MSKHTAARLQGLARQVAEIAEGKVTDQGQALRTIGGALKALLEASAESVEARLQLMETTLRHNGEVDARLQDIEASLMLHGLRKPDDGDKVETVGDPDAHAPEGGSQPEPEQVPG